MTEFERSLVEAINRYFGKNDVSAVAYRRKQHRFSSQVLDILVDSYDRGYYLGVECKSISTKKGSKKLYFSQHFSNGQIDRISEFLQKSGRSGWLAIELRKGRGRSREAHMVSWNKVMDRRSDNESGLGVEEIREGTELVRDSDTYVVSPLFE